MHIVRTIIILILLLHLQNFCISQIELTLTIENEFVEGDDFYFEIYLQRTSDSSQGDIFLKDANFILSYNQDNFTNPTLNKVGSGPGYSTLKPSISSPSNDLLTSTSYFDNSIAEIYGDKLIIDLRGPAPADKYTFDNSVAKINSDTSVHCLGRFKLSGISNPNETAGLRWHTSGGSLVTTVLSMEHTEPFTSFIVQKLIAINPDDISLPVSILNFQVVLEDSMVKLIWQAKNERNNQGFTIEKRISNNQWKTIGYVSSNHTTYQTSDYSFTDIEPLRGINYYRLKQIDFNGEFAYSPIRSIYFSNSEGIDIFPNPVSTVLFVEQNTGNYFQILDTYGKKQKEGILDSNQINVEDLPTGLYLISIDGITNKFIKW